MISLLLLSCSRRLADGIRELALELNKELSVYAVGGSKDGSVGVNCDDIRESLNRALNSGPVIVLFDSAALFNAVSNVIEELSHDDQSKIFLSDAAIVEGAASVSSQFAAGVSVSEIMSELNSLSLNKF